MAQRVKGDRRELFVSARGYLIYYLRLPETRVAGDGGKLVLAVFNGLLVCRLLLGVLREMEKEAAGGLFALAAVPAGVDHDRQRGLVQPEGGKLRVRNVVARVLRQTERAERGEKGIHVFSIQRLPVGEIRVVGADTAAVLVADDGIVFSSPLNSMEPEKPAIFCW